MPRGNAPVISPGLTQPSATANKLVNIISQNIAPKKRHICDPLHSDATSRPPAVHSGPLPLRPSPTVHRHQSFVFRHLQKFLLSSLRRGAFPPVQRDDLRDPLDVPATLSRHPNLPAGDRKS
ncbi:hypothetical protein K503DRAFT_804398 [Rhizopogon vinicolor AM-OR11-026]|uniref:Uncharacterized protein n=1 Tax=Rhizopogon vinicolor AM-OR11-026 TaxID=1314800 RepID=A0A1B7MLC4_9AGAM|nr:hypothetical protein K503DRAFT_804398 [Rhizopogon vinicolor AM-OR11-026]